MLVGCVDMLDFGYVITSVREQVKSMGKNSLKFQKKKFSSVEPDHCSVDFGSKNLTVIFWLKFLYLTTIMCRFFKKYFLCEKIMSYSK